MTEPKGGWHVERRISDKEHPMKMTYILPLLALFALTACETFEGFGRDVGTAGAVITDEAQEAQY